ncbi:MAG: hypothetical protein AABY83_11465 [Pseudomonadota bacterium]
MGAGATQTAWSIVCHMSYGLKGHVALLRYISGHWSVQRIPSQPSNGKEGLARPYFLGIEDDDRAVIYDPTTHRTERQQGVYENAFPLYAYIDRAERSLWFVHDGGDDTGNENWHCGDEGSPAFLWGTRTGGNPSRALLGTLCVGRGHHVTAYTRPSATFPRMPRQVFISNLLDGTITVVGYDPAARATYLKPLHQFNLCDPAQEQDPQPKVPNNAFPHGMAYSPVSGKVYNLNNGYGTVVAMDAAAHRITNTVAMPVASNLLMSPDGRFLIGKGADRKRDPQHVIGRLSVFDVTSETVQQVLDIPDLYPSTYRFSPDGQRLFVTSAATGKGEQKTHLKVDVVQVYDTSRLPALRLIAEIKVGRADCSRRPMAFVDHDATTRYGFMPNPTDGSVSVVDTHTLQVVTTLEVGAGGADEINFSYWRGDSEGC